MQRLKLGGLVSSVAHDIRQETYPHTRDGFYGWLKSRFGRGFDVFVAEVDHLDDATLYRYTVSSRGSDVLGVEGWGRGSRLELSLDTITQSSPFDLETPALEQVTPVAPELYPLSLTLESIGFHLMSDNRFSRSDIARIVGDCSAGDLCVTSFSDKRDGTLVALVYDCCSRADVAYIVCQPAGDSDLFSLSGIEIICD